MKSPKIMKNPWLNISLSDTVADCDKSVINSLTTAVKSKIVLDTLPEPYHGDPEAKVYLLNGNPGHSEKDLTLWAAATRFRRRQCCQTVRMLSPTFMRKRFVRSCGISTRSSFGCVIQKQL